MRSPRWLADLQPHALTRAACAACAACALGGLVACPSPRGDGPGTSGSASASASAILPSPSASLRGRSSLPESAIEEATAGVALRVGVGLPADPGATDAEVVAMQLDFSLRRSIAVSPSREPSFSGRVGAITVELADGRARLRLGAATFALPEGSQLRLSRGYVGALWIAAPTDPSPGYRIVPPGALRTFVTEARADVVPFGPTRITATTPVEWLGRPAERTTLTTSYGRLLIDQIAAPHPSPRAPFAPAPSGASAGSASAAAATASPSPSAAASNARGDAGRAAEAGTEAPTIGLDGAGEPLCRSLLELVASDRALGGAPCDAEHVPVRVEIAWSGGGGLLLEATALRERPLARSELAFPPARLRIVPPPQLGDGASFLLEPPRGETVALELVDGALLPRLAIVDGVVVGWIAPGRALTVAVPRGRRHVEWQSLFGETAETAIEADAPSRVIAGQAIPTPLPSASAIASVRAHP
jgi:hypothetical protein